MKISKKHLVTLAALALIALGSNYADIGRSLPSSEQQGQQHSSAAQASGAHSAQWSHTSPAVNQWHIFDGEINRKGKPVGFHSRPDGQDPVDARVLQVKSKANSAGVYTATIEVRDGDRWLQKFSSFFPDDMSEQEVVNAVLHAYKNSNNPRAQPWRGPSGHQFVIQGYTLNHGDINTAFPMYVRD
jgi:hypothetical protein